MTAIIVQEYARLTTQPTAPGRLDEATVSASAFDWLCKESARLRKSGANLVQIDGERRLRLDNYVGVIETPCGTRIEILPKTTLDAGNAVASRRTLRRMLATCLDLPVRETSVTSIQTFDAPLSEWILGQFVDALDRLVKRGVRFDYRRVEEHQRFLRGRLQLDRQLQQPPGRDHMFHIEHEIFDADRPENRLLRSALDVVGKRTRNDRTWRLSHELLALLASVPPSQNFPADFRRWGDNRLIAHYRDIKPWCALILNEQDPQSLLGKWQGRSLLFPMEKVFEAYVGRCLKRSLPTDMRVISTASSKYLCTHRASQWFQLKPDFLLRRGDARGVLDTKWKLIDQRLGTTDEKYGLSQGDFYQLFAYGHRYLDGAGDLFLAYPRTSRFDAPLAPFEFDGALRLWVVPFDVDAGYLVLPETMRNQWGERASEVA